MGRKILIADDHAEIAELVAMVLDTGDTAVFLARDGEQALEMVREYRPDLVLSDVQMPRLDGRELCRRIKSDPSTSGTRVVLMSTIVGTDPAWCHADGVIRKPFDILSIPRTVDQFLAKAA